MEDFLPVIQTAPLFAGVGGEEVRSMLHCLEARTKSFEKGEYIIRAGDAAESVGLLLSGSALILQEDFWGNRNLVAYIAPGQIFAEAFACLPGTAFTISVEAAKACTVLLLNVQRILAMCPAACPHHSRVIKNLVSDLAGKNLRFNEKLTHMGQRTTRGKLLSYLSAEAGRHGGPEFEIPFTRQQLADYLSVDRSGLSAELCRMRDEGILAFHKNKFTLFDRT